MKNISRIVNPLMLMHEYIKILVDFKSTNKNNSSVVFFVADSDSD
jgi:hypothetical protein